MGRDAQAGSQAPASERGKALAAPFEAQVKRAGMGFASPWTAVSQDIDRKRKSARDERTARMELGKHAEG